MRVLNRILVVVLAGAAPFSGTIAIADEIEFLNGSKLDGSVIAIHKPERQVEFEAVIGGKNKVDRYPYAKIHRVVWNGKEYIVTRKPAASPAAPTMQKAVTRTQSEVNKLISDVGSTPADWLAETPLDFPKTLDLKWPKKPPEGWNNKKNVGQYLWDKINPNAGRWRGGVKLMTHLQTLHARDKELQGRVMATMASMYFRFFQDYARAAYWWEKAESSGAGHDGVGLAECYFRLGNARMAREQLKSLPLSLARIKLLGDMGEFREALKFAETARIKQPQPLYLIAGDICRLNGKFKQAVEWYEKVLSAPEAENKDYNRRFRGRARESIDSIKHFELLDLTRLGDGVYNGSAMGYEGPVEIAATIRRRRIEKVEIISHKEKQYYSALTDVPAQIIRKQDLKKVEATSRATITAVAVINATAQALTGDPEP